MNPDRLEQFQAWVAGIVGPLAAGGFRKRRMAEELLAHLCQAYEQERLRNDDDEAAVEAAVRRLGNATELSNDLQACVPFPELILSLGRKEIFMSRWLWLLLGFLAAFLGTGLVLPALAKYKVEGSLPKDAAFALAVGALIVLLGVALVGFSVGRMVVRRA